MRSGTDQSSTAVLASLALFAGVVAIGSSPILIRVSELAPTATAFHRVALATPIFFVLMRAQEGRTQYAHRAAPGARDWGWLGFAGLLFAVDLACLHWSLAYTSVANSILLLNFAPFFVAGIGWAVFGERIGLRFVTILLLALAGVALLVGAGGAGTSATSLFGDGLALTAGAAYGGYLATVSRFRHVSTFFIMAVTTAACAAALFPAVLISGEGLAPATAQGWLTLLALALLTHAGGQGLIAYALQHLSAATSAATLLLQPVVAAAAAWVIFGEHLGAMQMVGAAIVLASVFLCHYRRAEAGLPAPP